MIIIIIYILIHSAFINNTLTIDEVNALKDLFNSTLGENWNNNDGWKYLNNSVCQKTNVIYGLTCSKGRPFILDLEFNNLRGELKPSIGKLTTITKILFKYNFISGNLPREIGNLVNMNYLDLSFNQFSGYLPEEFIRISIIKNIFLQSNNLSGGIPIKYCLNNNLLDNLYLFGKNLCPTCDYSLMSKNSDYDKWNFQNKEYFCDNNKLIVSNSNKDTACRFNCRDPSKNYNTCEKFLCSIGYKIPETSSKPMCLPSGEWEFTSCQIIENYCKIVIPNNATLVSQNTRGVRIGEVIKFKCNNGFKTQKNNKNFILEKCEHKSRNEGILVSEDNSCLYINDYCKSGNGIISPYNARIGDSVMATCEKGYQFSLNVYKIKTKCVSKNENKGNFDPMCLLRNDYCIVQSPQNGKINGLTGLIKLKINETAVYTCENAYSFGGTSIGAHIYKRRCESNKLERGILSKVDPGDCSLMMNYCIGVAPQNGKINGKSYSLGYINKTFEYTCDYGYKLNSKMFSFKCSLGNRTHGIITNNNLLKCSNLYCHIKPPKNGLINYSINSSLNININTTITLSCKQYYSFKNININSYTKKCIVNSHHEAELIGYDYGDCFKLNILLTVFNNNNNSEIICNKFHPVSDPVSILMSSCNLKENSKVKIINCKESKVYDVSITIMQLYNINTYCTKNKSYNIKLIYYEKLIKVIYVFNNNFMNEWYFQPNVTISEIKTQFNINESTVLKLIPENSFGELSNENTLEQLYFDKNKTINGKNKNISSDIIFIKGIIFTCNIRAPINGYINNNLQTILLNVNEVANIYCDYGYKFENNEYGKEIKFVCEKKGDNYSTEKVFPTICIKKNDYCSYIPKKDNNIINENKNLLKVKENIMLRCKLGYAFNKVLYEFRLTCMSNDIEYGLLNGRDFKCEKINNYCIANASKNSLIEGKFQSVKFSVYETINVTCKNGSKLNNKGTSFLTIICMPGSRLKGVLSEPMPNCYFYKKNEFSCNKLCYTLTVISIIALFLIVQLIIYCVNKRRAYGKESKYSMHLCDKNENVGNIDIEPISPYNLKEAIEKSNDTEIPEIVAGITSSPKRRDILKLLKEVHSTKHPSNIIRSRTRRIRRISMDNIDSDDE